jgi:hypothetical protein
MGNVGERFLKEKIKDKRKKTKGKEKTLVPICNRCHSCCRKGTDYNRAAARARITTEQPQGHGLQIRASICCELGEAKSAPAS